MEVEDEDSKFEEDSRHEGEFMYRGQTSEWAMNVTSIINAIGRHLGKIALLIIAIAFLVHGLPDPTLTLNF